MHGKKGDAFLKFKRILATAFALALTLPLLAVSAHPGRTDSAGGHTDSDTGDYHYHHGYEAHAHFDIDGNGTIDCPYDFDDQTGRNSGTSTGSGSYTPGDGSEDGYQEGYANGYLEGNRAGSLTGYENGYYDAEVAYAELSREAYAKFEQRFSYLKSLFLKVSCVLFAALLLTVFFLRRSIKKRKADQLEYERSIDAARNRFRQEIRELEESHQLQLDALRDSCESRVSKVTSGYSRLAANLQAERTAELKKLQFRLANFKRLEALELIAQAKDDSIQLPEGVALRPTYTPIRGKTSKRYPYGSYTIFMTPTGKTYHCLHDCSPNARPSHFFDRPKDASPCRKCVPLDTYPQDLPDWYIRLREKVESIVPDESAPIAPHHLPPATDDQIRFCLDDPQIQFSFKDNSNTT